MTGRALASLILISNLVSGLCADSLLSASSNQTSFIASISLDPDNNIHIAYSDGMSIQPPREENQEACQSPAIAEDKQTAGWLVSYKNPAPATSYPIPTALVIYRSGKVIRKIGNGFMFGGWYFLKGGKQVAFHTDTVHGSLAPYYELRDIETDKVIDKWEGPLGEKSPDWAKRLSK